MKPFKIKNKYVGKGCPCYIIAEMSANHHQDFDRAKQIIDAAADAGVDAIKLQTYRADTITIDCDNDHFLIKGTIWEGKNLYNLYEEAYTPWEWQPKLKNYANSLGLHCFSSPFDDTAVDFLEAMDVPVHKVASFEMVDIPLLKKIASTKKPVIMSTGMATLGEIEEAVNTLRTHGTRDLVLLKCTSAYPAPPEEANLHTIPHLSKTFNVGTGLSDHTMGTTVPVAAVALGACVIEKHLTLSRDEPGPDSSFSLEPHEFKALVKAVRMTEKALGEICYTPTEKQIVSKTFRRSLFVVKDIAKGDIFTHEHVRSIRPAHGLHTRHLDDVIGMRATKDIKRGTPLEFKHFEDIQ